MYNIIIPQSNLSIVPDLDLVDAAILVYCQAIIQTKHYSIAKKRLALPESSPASERKMYTWIDYGHLMKNMPLLRIKTKRAMFSRLKKLVKFGLLEKETYRRYMPYFRLTRFAEEILNHNK